jgi:hypothetical protein
MTTASKSQKLWYYSRKDNQSSSEIAFGLLRSDNNEGPILNENHVHEAATGSDKTGISLRPDGLNPTSLFGCVTVG